MLSDLHPEASALVTRVAACFILSFLTTGRPGAPGEGRGLFPPNLSCHLDPDLLPSCQPFGCLLDRKRRTTPTPSPPPIPGGTGVHRCAARLCLHEAKTKTLSCCLMQLQGNKHKQRQNKSFQVRCAPNSDSTNTSKRNRFCRLRVLLGPFFERGAETPMAALCQFEL